MWDTQFLVHGKYTINQLFMAIVIRTISLSFQEAQRLELS